METGIWLVVHGNVYDATGWVLSHPGGVNAILNRAGGVEDASRDYDFHSDRARAMWRTLLLGRLEREPGERTADCAVM